jgi:hypothetical protein
MFKWFKPIDSVEGLEEMRARVGDMLSEGRHIFDAAANAFLGGADPEIILREVGKALDGAPKTGRIPDLWDGHSAGRIADILERDLGEDL